MKKDTGMLCPTTHDTGKPCTGCEQCDLNWTKPGSAEEHVFIHAARAHHYPKPDSPHTSVLNRHVDQSQAFEAGWAECRATLASGQAQPAVNDYVALFLRCAYPVAHEIDPRGYRWCESWLDSARTAALAATQPAAAPDSQKVTYGPNNPPRLRMPGESVQEYRVAMGWDKPAAAPAEQGDTVTDISHRLRKTADQQPGWRPLLTAAADECDRFYNGMMNWKARAQAKDRTIIDLRAALAAQVQPVAEPEGWRRALEQIEHSMLQARNPGNDRLREINLVLNIVQPMLSAHSTQPADGGGDA